MLLRLFSFTGLALACALFATVVQAVLALRALQEKEPLARSVIAIDDWRREVSWLHPIRRRKHREQLRKLLKDSPAEGAAYERVRWALVSWSMLATGAAMALIGHVIGA